VSGHDRQRHPWEEPSHGGIGGVEVGVRVDPRDAALRTGEPGDYAGRRIAGAGDDERQLACRGGGRHRGCELTIDRQTRGCRVRERRPARHPHLAARDAAPLEQRTTAPIDQSPAALARLMAVIAHRERNVDQAHRHTEEARIRDAPPRSRCASRPAARAG
jgi:hypothetical protein